jgi:hypothetical protein
MSGIKRIESEGQGRRRHVLHAVHDWERDVAIAASEARERIDCDPR